MNGLLLAVEMDAGALAAFLLLSALKGAVVLGVAGLLVLILRRRPAAWRHLVWTLAIAAVLVAPLLAPVAPRWEVPGLRFEGSFLRGDAGRAIPSEQVTPSARVTPVVGFTAVRAPTSEGVSASADAPATAPSSARSGSPSPAPAPAASAVESSESGPAPAASERRRSSSGAGVVIVGEGPRPRESASSEGVSAAVTPRSAGSRPPPATGGGAGPWLAGLWVAGLFAVLSVYGRSLLQRRRLEGEAFRVCEGPVFDMAMQLGRDLGIRRRIVLLAGPAEIMPMTWGVVRPRVLLPARAAGWPAPRLRAVLMHELAHVKRFDYVVRVCAWWACALHWFNPLVWLAARRLRLEGELACDDHVLRRGTLPSDYASQLLAVARSLRPRRLVGVLSLPMARTSQLGHRVQAALDPARGREGLGRAGLLVALLSATVTSLAVAGAALGGGEPPPQPEGEPLEAAPVRYVDADVEPSSEPQGSRAPLALAGSEPPVAREISPIPLFQAGGALCDWDADGPSSTSVNVTDDHYRIRIERGDCELEIELDGELEVNDAETQVTGLSAGGELEIEEKRGRESRRLIIEEARGGDLVRRWWVDGREVAYDAASAAWLGDMLSLLFRRAGYEAQERARRILAREGVDGLLDEISRIRSDHVARRYYTVLLSEADLDPGQVREIVSRLSEEIDSDHELARLLIAIAERHPLDRAVQAAYVEAAGSIESDHELARVLLAILSRQDLDPEAAASMLRAATTIDSDHELTRLLTQLLRRGRLDAAQADELAEAIAAIDSDFEMRRVLMAILESQGLDRPFGEIVLEAAAEIGSDHELGRVLRSVAESYPGSRPLPDSYFAAARSVDSDRELSNALRAVVEREPAVEEDVASVLDLASLIESDHELARLLRELAGRHPLDGALRSAFMRAVDTIESSRERQRVLDALSR